MGSNHRTSLRLAARACIAFVVAYVLVAMSIFAPVARAKMAEESRQAAMLGVLCLPDGNGDLTEDGKPAKPHHHDLGCCIPGKRFVLDAPAILVDVPAFHAPQVTPRPVVFAIQQPRAPPFRAFTAANARAPPLPA